MKLNKLAYMSIFALLLTACNKASEEDVKKTDRLPLVTVATVHTQSLEIIEAAIGTIESLVDPTIASEISARIIKIHVGVGQTVKKGQLIAILDSADFGLLRQEAQAEAARIEVLLANQKRTVDRNQTLVNKNFISKNVLDDSVAQQNALQEQLHAAQIRVASATNTGTKTQIFSPVDGKVEKIIVDMGEFVSPGDPIMQIIGNKKLRAHIPLPESVASKIKPGLEIRLRSPVSDATVITKITEVRPLVMADNRSVDVIADVNNQPDWHAGASVNAQILLSKKNNVLMVPEQSVVLRPSGEVVYVIHNNTAQQHIIKTGEQRDGWVEVLQGLETGVVVAVDGAAYLTDNTQVKILSIEKK